MALQTIDKLKSWFVTLAKPTQQQFWDWLDSYRHINTKITSSDLDAQLLQLLNNIPNRDALDQLIREFQEYNASLKALAFKDVADWNTDLQNKPTRLSEFQDDLGWQDELQSHIDDTDNPHEVTAAQIGLENVDNTSDLDKPVSNATKDALNRQEQDRLSFDNFLLSRVDVNTANIEMLNNITTVRGSVNTYAELQFINIGQEKIRAGDSYIVLKDESWGGNASIYVYNATGWIWVGEWTTQIQPANGDTLGTVQDSNDIKWSGGKGSVYQAKFAESAGNAETANSTDLWAGNNFDPNFIDWRISALMGRTMWGTWTPVSSNGLKDFLQQSWAPDRLLLTTYIDPYNTVVPDNISFCRIDNPTTTYYDLPFSNIYPTDFPWQIYEVRRITFCNVSGTDHYLNAGYKKQIIDLAGRIESIIAIPTATSITLLETEKGWLITNRYTQI